MNVQFSYKHSVRSPQVEKIINHRIGKLNKWLATFDPDLVHLHATLEYRNPREGFKTSLNLRLPVGQLFATEAGKTAQASIRAAFDELERQFNDKMQVLRGSKTRGTLEEPGGGKRLERRPIRG
jgi:ribosome-associated translation inhibitor RaiA